jgi:2-methylcitrate dehydratase PrpD
LTLSESLSTELATWSSALEFQDLPRDIVHSTKLRVLDTIGLALAGAGTDFGRSVRNAAITMSPAGACRLIGSGDRVGITAAAFANGACSQALEYDDTHNESIVHMSSPAVAAALGLAEIVDLSG